MFTKLTTIFAKDGTPITMVRIEKPITAENYEAFATEVSAALAFNKTREEAIRGDFSTESVRNTMIGQGRLFNEPYILSYHNGIKTVGCAGVQPYRINPEGKQDDIGEVHEVKMGIYAEKNGPIHVVVTPAIFEVENSALESARLIDPAELGLVEYTINPFNTVASLIQSLESDEKKSAILHFNDLEMLKSGFVYNNNGNNFYSCVTSAEEYVNAVSAAFQDLKGRFPERVTIISEKDNLVSLEQDLRDELGLKSFEPINSEALFRGANLSADHEAIANAGRDSGDSSMHRVQNTLSNYRSHFMPSLEKQKGLENSGSFDDGLGRSFDTISKPVASKLAPSQINTINV